MGDILHALPAVTALRQAHPEWGIDWVVEPRWLPLLAAEGSAGRGPSQPLVDGLYMAPVKDWGRAPLMELTGLLPWKARKSITPWLTLRALAGPWWTACAPVKRIA